LTLQEFTDLAEYLTSLKQPENALVSNRAMPVVLRKSPRPSPPVRYFSQALKIPRGRVQTGLTFFNQSPVRPISSSSCINPASFG